MADLLMMSLAVAVIARSLVQVLVVVTALYSRDAQRRAAAQKVLRALRSGEEQSDESEPPAR